MNKLKSLAAIAAAACLSACAPTTNSPSVDKSLTSKEINVQQEFAVKQQFGMLERAINVASPILKTNVGLCGKPITGYIGTEFRTQENLSKQIRKSATRLYGVKANPTVVVLANQGPAAEVLKIGDVVTHANGKAVPTGNKGIKFIEKELRTNKNNKPLKLRIKRAGSILDASIDPIMACDSKVFVNSSNEINAFANGKAIGITAGMMRFTNDDAELALVIGHELAHNSRKHIQAKRANAVAGAIVGVAISAAIGVNVTRIGTSVGAAAHSHGFETEADYVGMYHAARAGYDISNAASLFRRMAAASPNSIGLRSSHPSTAKRFVTLEATLQEIEEKRAAGLPLIPEEKKAKALSKQTS